WLQSYSNLLAEIGKKPVLQKECEAYRFGAGKVYYSSFYVIVTFRLGSFNVQLRTSIITGDIPLLLSKTVLGKLGMIYDVQNGKADFKAINLSDYKLTTTSSGHPAIPIVPVSVSSDETSDLQIEDLRLQTAEQYMSVLAVAHHGPHTPKYSGIFYEKKLDPSTRDMLSQDRLQQDIFVNWWENAGMDSRRCQSTTTPLSRMTKAQLLSEAVRVGAAVHHSWTVPELRATIRDHVDTYQEKTASQKMRGMSSMKIEDLRKKAKEMGVDVPDKVTKGNLLRLVRTSVSTTGDMVMTIGRWKGSLFRDIPNSYGKWALEEITRAEGNCSPELAMYAKWWQNQQLALSTTAEIMDEESDQDYPANTHPTSTPSRGSWEEVSVTKTKGYSGSTGKGNTKATPKRDNQVLHEKDEKIMDSQPDPSTLAEIQALETKLAILKDKARSSRQ
ncbi:unnamed protein product, partial [Symbiodinium sp. CCMP2456]